MDSLNSPKDSEPKVSLTPDALDQYLTRGHRVYFIGIGGISMGGLAELSFEAGLKVGGSDPHQPLRLERLRHLGITVDKRQDTASIEAFAPDLTVYSSAVAADNTQRAWSESHGIPTVERSVYLGWLTRQYRRVVNIAGTNGKTTTTAMCALMLMASHLEPSVHLGAELSQFDYSTVHVGADHELLISEACEYRDSFLDFYSTTAVILNIDRDHLDYFEDMDDIIDSFARFGANLPEGGHLIVPAAAPHIETCIRRMQALRREEGTGDVHIHTFGIRNSHRDLPFFVPEDVPDSHFPELHARNLEWEDGLAGFDVYFRGRYYTRIKMALPGMHHVLDALAAMLAHAIQGGTAEAAADVLRRFKGAEGRFTEKGLYRGARVISDYAHNPSKTRATLAAAHTIPHGKILVVYQPLTFERVRSMFDAYLEALKDADHTIFVEIYSDREKETYGMSSRLLADAMVEQGRQATFAETLDDVRAALDRIVEPGDLILFLGPEEVRDMAVELLQPPDEA